MRAMLASLEAWLRIDAARSPMTAARGRAIYTLGLVFTVTQLLNMVGMTIGYGGWTLDHWVAVGSIALVASTVLALRWCKGFAAYAGVYTAGCVAGVATAAVTVGIDSSLLPMLVWLPFACGMIAGWRSVVASTLVTMGLTVWLYGVSLGDSGVIVLAGQEFQRFVQALLALAVAGTMAAVFSRNLHAAFVRLRDAADRAQRAEAAKSDFLAQMSHELRTPLGGVIGLADALAASDLGPHERELTETIRSSGRSLLAILNDLLDLSKIEAGKLTVEPAPFSPGALVRSVAEGWREAGAARGTEVRYETLGAVPAWLAGDELRLRQVLDNFVSNAVKFTEGGDVCVVLEAEATEGGAARLTLTVTDTGRGIPEAMQAAVFERFDQGEAGTTRRYGGTGLGLPICRQLAELMGGEVRLVRSGPGGTAFALTIDLPLARAPSAAPAPSTPADLGGLRVLVAEDNAVNRMVAAEFLRALSVEAVFAEDGAEAVAAARLGGFDAVLMDKHMPGMGGVEATRAIRALGGEAASVPVVAVTADAMAGEREALLAAGMDGYLSKPLKLDALRDAIAEAVRAPAAARLRA